MKKQKYAKAVMILLVLVLFAVVEAMPAYAASNGTPPLIPTTGDVWDGSVEEPQTLVQKDGVYYYEITKCSQLAYVAQTGGAWQTYNYILGNNLILNDVILTWDDEGNCTNAETLLEWTPIRGFSGIFLGNGYTISGMYASITAEYYTGFFGSLYGDVDGILIVNSYVVGGDYTGGLAGSASKTGADIKNCTFSGAVKGGSNVGGLIGDADCQYVDHLINYADVFGENHVAGIIGKFYAYGIKDCLNYGDIHATGDYVGGIADYSDIYDISGCYNSGSVTGKNNVGGIIGALSNASTSSSCNYGSVT